jgi:hypothetical protein
MRRQVAEWEEKLKLSKGDVDNKTSQSKDLLAKIESLRGLKKRKIK